MKHPNFKRMLIAFVAGMILTCSVSASALTADQVGDVDDNQKITASDARKVLRHSAKLELLSDEVLDRADVNFDEKINASDARIILRVAAKLDTFDTSSLTETTTEEPTTEEPTTEEPTVAETTTEEPTTEEPTTEEPTTEEPTTEEPTTEEVSTEIAYPKAIDGLFENHYYFELTADGQTMGIARNGDEIEATAALGDAQVALYYSSDDTVYLKYETTGLFGITTKWYYGLDADDETFTMDMDIDEMLADYDFGSKDDYTDIVSYTEEVDGTEYTVYAFVTEDGSSACFYADADDEVKMFCTKDSEGNSNNDEVYFSTLSYDIPDGMCSIEGRINDALMTGLLQFMQDSGMMDSL